MTSLRAGLIVGGTIACFLLTACGTDSPSGPPLSTGSSLSPGIPDGWGGTTGTGGTYQIGIDRTDHHGGNAAAYFIGPASTSAAFATLVQSLRADTYRGKRLRWSAWVRHEGVVASVAGLWMRVDGPGVMTAFDNMGNRPLSGSADWHQISVVLDVGQNAIGIALGALMQGTGTLVFDDMKLEVVGTDVQSTNTVGTPTPSGVDSATTAANYARAPGTPINLDFEGVTGAAQQTVAWLTSNVVPLTTTDPQASLDDLQPLTQAVGSAHLIGLGEDTHGTREFFRMKHRVLEFLVKQMGATNFAIEATSPESDDMNQYVLKGQGDPKKLLSRLYFWTWNTQEVLDMIQWMHDWNTTAPAAQRVQFRGFDMQSPGAAMDSVAAFMSLVDPAQTATVAQNYSCLGPYRNHAQLFGASISAYAALPATTKTACATGLQQVFDLINSHLASYQGASSPSVYQSVLHDARMVQQFEAMAAIANAGASSLSRDKSMAENIGWIRDQAPAGSRIVLWAHNGHINSVPQYMGGYLRANYAADYVNLGFVFGHGGFNAVGVNAPLQPWDAELIPANSIEAVFVGTGKQLALFDTRLIPGGGTAAAPLAGPIPMRSIGALFDRTAEGAYFGRAILPGDFDLLIYVNATTPSTLLPFVY